MRFKEYWHKIFVIIPKQTLGGEYVWGNCYRKFTPVQPGPSVDHLWKPEYVATRKEVFLHKLTGENNDFA